MGNILSQLWFFATPSITEKNCPDQTGRVFLVTGGYGGVGFELCKILYAANATVWIAGRSESKAEAAITTIRSAAPKSKGQIEFLQIDLSDLTTVKPAAEKFLAQVSRLDVLVNNAAVMFPAAGSVDSHGNELQMGTNCLGPYLLHEFLSPLLTKTAANSPAGSVRVAWASSISIFIAVPKGGIAIDADGKPTDQGVKKNYGQTKAGNVFFARLFAKQTPETGVVHVSFNPGNLRTNLQRHWEGLDRWMVDKFMLLPPIFGAYTELWAAIAPEITTEKSGAYVYPWGRIGAIPAEIEASMKGTGSGPGVSDKWINWCVNRTKEYK
ncbi:hypothetical protein GGR50DRAFT_686614 [Xylaria sp. CBS 124048]|nr:hypothetical protein GGR50DRAFT_686614 [Xylaria sp. CBS 124048]